MEIDIILITFNSEKWIENCFKSIYNSNYDLKKISIIIIDNNSKDNTINKLNKEKEKYKNIYKNFKILESKENLGFGGANNLGVRNSNSPYIFFLNIDTELEKNSLEELEKSIKESKEDVAIWELRQFPYEHPKLYNPMSLETSWASGSAFIIKREVFEHLGGFDKHIFMYTEDVDLSWKTRVEGYKIKYVPRAIVYHYCYKEPNEIKPLQYVSAINNLLLRYRFGNVKDIIIGYMIFLWILIKKEKFKGSKKILLKEFFKHYLKIYPFIKWKILNKRKLKKFEKKFYGLNYELKRKGAFYYNQLPITTPKVSVIVRTCGRPYVLKEALLSLRNQTYNNIEIIVIEDGENLSEDMINREFSDLKVKYKCTRKKLGRSKVGNYGLKLATGKYINFLDDDDLLFADHIEVLVSQLEKNKEYGVAYSLAFETPIKIISKEPYTYKEKCYKLKYNIPFNRLLLFRHNYLPILCVMFKKKIFFEEGGFDEGLNLLEDWDLWIRYASKNKFLYVNKITSIYRIPFDREENKERIKLMKYAVNKVREKQKNIFPNMGVLEISKELEDAYIFKIPKHRFEGFNKIQKFIIKMIIKIIKMKNKLKDF